MEQKFIPFSPPLIGDEEIKEVIDSIQSGWITSGPKVSLFESEICKYVGAGFGAASFSCTSSLFLTLKALGIKPGDEVIVPTFTFASTAHVVVHCGAKPVFVDIDAKTLQMDTRRIEEKITKNTKAIIPVHYGGNAAELDDVYELAKKFGLHVVEDAAHAIGTEYKGRKIGSHQSDAVCYSFYATKNLAAAEGGMTVSSNKELIQTVKKLAMYGISDSREIWQNRYSQKGHWFYDIEMIGYKANMTDINAAIGIHQLRKLDQFNATRARYAETYMHGWQSTGLEFIKVLPHVKSSWHLFPVLLPSHIDRDQFILSLKEKGVGTSVLFRPLHLHTAYRNLLGHQEGDFPVSEAIFNRIVNMPISPAISSTQISYIVGVVHDLLKSI